MEKKRIFVDMDGTLAVFKPVEQLEVLYEEGYFRNLAPQINVLQAVKKIIQEYPDVEVYVLSAYLSDSPYALHEKNEWLNRFLPELDFDHRVFVPCGEDKSAFVPGKLNQDDYLLDDYTVNLNAWEPPARGIKVLNGINGTHGTWQGSKISFERNPEEMASLIYSAVINNERIDDIMPVKESQEMSRERLSEIASKAIDGLIEDGEEEALEYINDTLELTEEEKEYFGVAELERTISIR